MLTYWLPWPGNRNASLPARGPLPRKMPCAWSAFHAGGVSKPERPLGLLQLVEQLVGVAEVDRPAARAPRGRAAIGQRRPAGTRPLAHAGQQPLERAPSARAGAARRARRCRAAAPLRRRRGRRSRGSPATRRRDVDRGPAGVVSAPGHVLLEHQVEVRAAEAVGAHAGAPRRAVARGPLAQLVVERRRASREVDVRVRAARR